MTERPAGSCHEGFEVGGKRLIAWGFGVLLLLGVALGATWLLAENESGPALSPSHHGIGGVPEPRLQIDAGAELQAFRAEKRSQLNTYGWVDRDAGIAHIPIRRAMELMASGKPESRPSSRGPSP